MLVCVCVCLFIVFFFGFFYSAFFFISVNIDSVKEKKLIQTLIIAKNIRFIQFLYSWIELLDSSHSYISILDVFFFANKCSRVCMCVCPPKQIRFIRKNNNKQTNKTKFQYLLILNTESILKTEWMRKKKKIFWMICAEVRTYQSIVIVSYHYYYYYDFQCELVKVSKSIQREYKCQNLINKNCVSFLFAYGLFLLLLFLLDSHSENWWSGKKKKNFF